MNSLFLQLNDNLEELKSGIAIRRKARRNWMERLMQESETEDDHTPSEQQSQTGGSPSADARH